MSESKTYLLSDSVSDLAAIAARVKAAGGPAIDATEPSGQASADEVTIGWSIADGRIVVTVLRKPWIVSYGMIWSHIDSVLG